MKPCPYCSKSHNVSYHLEKKIPRKGFPTSNRNYHAAHSEANKAEKKAYPKGYEQMKKVDAKLSSNELAGKNTRSGKIEVSAKVPRAYRAEVALHERVENQKLRHLSKKHPRG